MSLNKWIGIGRITKDLEKETTPSGVSKLKFTIAEFAVEAIAKLCGMAKYRQRLSLAAGDVPTMTLTLRKTDEVLPTALALIEDLRLASGEKAGETAEK